MTDVLVPVLLDDTGQGASGSTVYYAPANLDSNRALGVNGGSLPAFVTTPQPNKILTQWASGREICGIDPVDNRFFFFNGTPGLYQTENPTSTAFVSKGIPASTTLGRSRMVRFGAKLYLYIKQTGGPAAVYSTDPVANPTAFTWSSALWTGAANSDTIMTNLCAGSQYLFVSEYGDPTGGPSVYRSSNGTVWTTVLGPIATARHCHGLAEDPYNAGHIYASFGDGSGIPAQLYRSIDHGANWTPILTDSGWQHVQVSFSANYVWFAGDSATVGFTVGAIERKSGAVQWMSADHHQDISVPGGVGGRTITDAAFTSGSPTLTSATAAFTAQDVGKMIRGTQQVIDRTFISAFTNATTVTMSQNAGATVSAQTITIGGDTFAGNAYYGAVDPASEIYYCVANDSGNGGTAFGLFALDRPGGRLRLVDTLHSRADNAVFISNGFVWCSRYQRPLISLASA